jgi:hypothetical protein
MRGEGNLQKRRRKKVGKRNQEWNIFKNKNRIAAVFIFLNGAF